MFRKVLVANRGEIAVRAFRAATELGARTVAVFPYEDRDSLHRQKADESYQIGEPGHPVRAYLDVDEIIRVARLAGADAVYPGYGFLSENPGLAEACEATGITFIGPPARVLRRRPAPNPSSGQTGCRPRAPRRASQSPCRQHRRCSDWSTPEARSAKAARAPAAEHR